MQRIYKNKQEENKARAKRERERRLNNPKYNRYVALRNNYGAVVAKKYCEVIECEECGFSRIGFYIEVHHLIPQKDGGKNTLDNVIGLCYYCHREKHRLAGFHKNIMTKEGFKGNIGLKHMGTQVLTGE